MKTMEESSSNRKSAVIFATRKATVIAMKVLFYVASAAFIIVIGTTFAGSLSEVKDLVEEGVIPKPLYTFVISGICLAAVPMILRRIKI